MRNHVSSRGRAKCPNCSGELEGVSTEGINSSASQRYERFLMLGATQEVAQETVPLIDGPDVSIWRQVYRGPASYSEFFESLGGDPTLRNTRLTYNRQYNHSSEEEEDEEEDTEEEARRRIHRETARRRREIAAAAARQDDSGSGNEENSGNGGYSDSDDMSHSSVVDQRRIDQDGDLRQGGEELLPPSPPQPATPLVFAKPWRPRATLAVAGRRSRLVQLMGRGLTRRVCFNSLLVLLLQ